MYCHNIEEKKTGEELLSHVHLVISLIRRWIMGTLQGSYSKEYPAYYFDEYRGLPKTSVLRKQPYEIRSFARLKA
jgi:hypothetical protein